VSWRQRWRDRPRFDPSGRLIGLDLVPSRRVEIPGRGSAVRLKLYDRRGRLIGTIFLEPGEDFREFEWIRAPKVKRAEIVRDTA